MGHDPTRPCKDTDNEFLTRTAAERHALKLFRQAKSVGPGVAGRTKTTREDIIKGLIDTKDPDVVALAEEFEQDRRDIESMKWQLETAKKALDDQGRVSLEQREKLEREVAECRRELAAAKDPAIDPRILGVAETFIVRDNQVVDLARYRHNAIAASASKMNRLAGLTLAADDDPDGFRVKWAGTTRDEAWARNNPGQ